ncbi:hypothetical protein DPMN_109748 [Dreissena polymorpha]|uniref:Uncharacterized protein n=1 Tax=Dreissena polymorpha TaxID=45954 RepID=A0A9D4KAV5_DREPO|nr:hypothetical protein DPMN_109748 [Dreissena polymorpha]
MRRRARAFTAYECVSRPRICRTTGRLGQASSNNPTSILSCLPQSCSRTVWSKPISPSATTPSFLYSLSICWTTPSTSPRGALGCTPKADPKPATQGYSLG